MRRNVTIFLTHSVSVPADIFQHTALRCRHNALVAELDDCLVRLGCRTLFAEDSTVYRTTDNDALHRDARDWAFGRRA